MYDNWLRDAIAGAAETVRSRATHTAKEDVYRNGLRLQIEEMLDQPLPEKISGIICALSEKGYHIHEEMLYPYSNSKEPMSVGLTGERFVTGAELVSWRKISRHLSVWTDPHLINSKRKSLVLQIDIIPADSETVLYKIYVNGHQFESCYPEDEIDITEVRRLIAENIKSNGLLPRRK